MSRKEKTFNQLLSYIDLPAQKGKKPILFNLRSTGDYPQKIVTEFFKNAQFCGDRKNGVYLYHEILSVSEGDRGVISEEILEDLAEHYLQLRAPGALAYGRVHFNRKNPHIHLMISANEVNSRKKIRLSKSQFQRVKRDLETYQKRHYPQLVNSIVQEPNKRKRKIQTAEQERTKRLKKQNKQIPTRKEKIKILFLQILKVARGESLFIKALEAEGLTLYQRGKILGLRDQGGKKYRLRTIGVLEDYEKRSSEWNRKKYRKIVLVEIEKQKEKQRFTVFKKAVLTVLETPFSKRAVQLWQVNRNNIQRFYKGRKR